MSWAGFCDQAASHPRQKKVKNASRAAAARAARQEDEARRKKRRNNKFNRSGRETRRGARKQPAMRIEKQKREGQQSKKAKVTA